MSLLTNIGLTIGMRLVSSGVVTKLLEFLLFFTLEQVAKRTDNSVDDEIIAIVKAAYYSEPVKLPNSQSELAQGEAFVVDNPNSVTVSEQILKRTAP